MATKGKRYMQRGIIMGYNQRVGKKIKLCFVVSTESRFLPDMAKQT
jgi:hypothetical protein